MFGLPGDTRWVGVWSLGFHYPDEPETPSPAPDENGYSPMGDGRGGAAVAGLWVVWPLLLTEFAMLLLLGGGLMTWVVR